MEGSNGNARDSAVRRSILMAHPTSRIRHCAECPKCLTRYLIGFSPYRNRSYLVPMVAGSGEEYMLYCACGRPLTPSRWHWSEFKAYAVSKPAHRRGYGSPDEIMPVDNDVVKGASFDRQLHSESDRERGSK